MITGKNKGPGASQLIFVLVGVFLLMLIALAAILSVDSVQQDNPPTPGSTVVLPADGSPFLQEEATAQLNDTLPVSNPLRARRAAGRLASRLSSLLTQRPATSRQMPLGPYHF